MLDMSGMVSGCQESTYWYEHREDDQHHHMYTVKDDLKQVWQSPHRLEFIKRLQSGERVPECRSCWDKEDLGVPSLRQITNKLLEDVEAHPDQPKVFIIKPGIQCNNACRSCNEITSTAWFKDAYQFDRDAGYDKSYKIWLQKYKPHTTIYKNNTLLEQTFDEWQENLIFWDIYGGEPLMIPLFYKIMQSSIAAGAAKNQMLGIHTNATIYDPDLVKYFREFQEVSFAVSIDGVGRKNDYLRWGSRWEEVLVVADKYVADMTPYKNIKISIRCSPTILNVYDLPELYQVQKQRQWPVTYQNYVLDEPHNNIQYMPYDLKLKVAERLDPIGELRPIVKFLMGTPPDYTHENQMAFWHHNNKLDQLRGESFAEVFPEWHALWADWVSKNQ